MRAHFGRALACAALTIAVNTSLACAQGTRGADTLSPAAVAESLKVLGELDRRVRANGNDAPAWYRLGMVAWALAERGKAPNSPRGLDPTRYGRMADTSLRRAAQAAPGNARYKLMVGNYLLSSGLAMSRSAAPGFFEQAVDAARRNGDSTNLVDALIEVGRVRWRKFEGLAHRRIETTPGSALRSINDAMTPAAADPESGVDVPMYNMKLVREALERGTMALPPSVTGESDYTQAGELFREAYGINPAHARTFRSVAMALAERDNWSELEVFARNQLKQIPWDAWAWMALGLASHRTGNVNAAAAAFDSAFTYLEPSERARLDRLDRLRPRGEVSRMVRGTDAELAAYRRLYWLFADPLWSRSGNESRVEYFSRVTFAELRWTVEEMHVLGADTDRGEVYVRFGPPDVQAAVGPDPSQGSGDYSLIWVYRSGLMFAFTGTIGFGTMKTPPGDLAGATSMMRNQPVRWDNVASIRVDSVPTQYARFRADHDSVDMYLAAQPPVDSIRKYSDVGALKGYVWLLTSSTALVFRDSAQLTAKGAQGWSRRVAPGTYVYRAEATTESSQRGGRATVLIDASASATSGFTAHGFDVSDLLFAASAEPRGESAKRWTDLNIAPTAGAVQRGGQLALIWENYEFGERTGTAQYQVVVTLTKNRTLAGRVAASIVGALAGIARVDQTDDRVAMTFERTMAYSPAFVDHITLSLGDTPRGSYTVTLLITDRVSGKTVTRSREFLIRD